MPSITFTMGPEISIWSILYAYDKTLDEVDFAFEKLKEIKPHILKFYAGAAEPADLLSSGQVDIALWFDGRTFGLQHGGADWLGFIYPEPKAIAGPLQIMKVKNAPDVAFDWINVCIDPIAQSAHSTAAPGYRLTNPKTEYPDWVRERLPSVDTLILPPGKELAEVRTEWVERWNKEIGG
jgi:putative spermidine/putrescine transport system substrate-binding protein